MLKTLPDSNGLQYKTATKAKKAMLKTEGSIFFSIINWIRLNKFVKINEKRRVLLSNYTFNIEKDCVSDWEKFLSNSVTPLIQAEKIHSDFRIFQLLTEIENDGTTYALQVYFESEEKAADFADFFQNRLLPSIHILFRDKYVFFHSHLKEFNQTKAN